MVKRMVELSMFYGASPKTFEFAKELRNNLTEAEAFLWARLRNKQLGVRFRSQHPIDRFIADFYCHPSKLVVEVDGDIHKKQKEYDINREAELDRFGIRVVRFSNEQVLDDIEMVINLINNCDFLSIAHPSIPLRGSPPLVVM